jgi:hypothetical protein
MSSKLTVVFYIILCLEAGVVLTLLPWVRPFGLMGDWSDNYFLVYAAQQVGLTGLQSAVGSGWVRGAVTGLGVLNLLMAFWEMAHFNQTVRGLQTQADAHAAAQRASRPAAATAPAHADENDAPRPQRASDLPDNGRPNV